MPVNSTHPDYDAAAVEWSRARDVQAIVAAWQAGAISLDTMHELFRRGEVLPEGRTSEEERRLIAQGGAANEQELAPGATNV